MKLDFFICIPAVIFDVIDLTGLQLYFLDVLVASERVNFRSSDTDG